MAGRSKVLTLMKLPLPSRFHQNISADILIASELSRSVGSECNQNENIEKAHKVEEHSQVAGLGNKIISEPYRSHRTN